MIKWVYHVTYFRNMDTILEHGLDPKAITGLSSPGYMGHSQGKTFFTDFEDVKYWYVVSEEAAEGITEDIFLYEFVPVVLAFSISDKDIKIDEAMVGDVHSAYYTKKVIEPEDILIWNGEEWVDISDYESIDISVALTFEDDEDSGDRLAYFKDVYDNNPLANVDMLVEE